MDGYKAEEVVLMIGTNNSESTMTTRSWKAFVSCFRHQATATGGQDQGNRHLPRRNQEERVRNLNLRIVKWPRPDGTRSRTRVRSASGRRQDKRILILRRINPNEEGYKQIVDEIAH
ncbi:MAG: hypothetical protein OSJ51_11910 [Parabacteroides distasonis]|nr:hypothetical protein [Parabacteroides distasonis]